MKPKPFYRLDDLAKTLLYPGYTPPLRCGARTRKGTPCERRGLSNNRCLNHGGLSTGPRTLEGKRRALFNLVQFRDKERELPL